MPLLLSLRFIFCFSSHSVCACKNDMLVKWNKHKKMNAVTLCPVRTCGHVRVHVHVLYVSTVSCAAFIYFSSIITWMFVEDRVVHFWFRRSYPNSNNGITMLSDRNWIHSPRSSHSFRSSNIPRNGTSIATVTENCHRNKRLKQRKTRKTQIWLNLQNPSICAIFIRTLISVEPKWNCERNYLLRQNPEKMRSSLSHRWKLCSFCCMAGYSWTSIEK